MNDQISWFMKYKPKTIDDLIFENSDYKKLFNDWIVNNRIPGNVILYGKGGVGKSASANILIKSIIKNKLDFKEMESRTVSELDNEIIPFIQKEPKNSNHKIVLIEEIDKLSTQSIGTLKTKTLENNQINTIFIATTNKINNIDEALLQRFTFKIPFHGKNNEDIFTRLKFILVNENAQFDETNLKDYINQNINLGIRELINQLQNSFICNNRIINFTTIKNNSSLEERIITLVLNILNIITNLDRKLRLKCAILPQNSEIGKEYEEITTTLYNNIDIDIEYIYERLKDEINFVPIKIIVKKHINEIRLKKYKDSDLISFIYEMIISLTEIIIGTVIDEIKN